VVPRLVDLDPSEVSALFTMVQRVGSTIENAFKADGLTIACQDGRAAGQSIAHVHIHVIPRKFAGDQFSERNDDIYPVIDKAEKELPQVQSLRVDDEGRLPRTMEEMEKEALLDESWHRVCGSRSGYTICFCILDPCPRNQSDR